MLKRLGLNMKKNGGFRPGLARQRTKRMKKLKLNFLLIGKGCEIVDINQILNNKLIYGHLRNIFLLKTKY